MENKDPSILQSDWIIRSYANLKSHGCTFITMIRKLFQTFGLGADIVFV